MCTVRELREREQRMGEGGSYEHPCGMSLHTTDMKTDT